jgi:protein involved in polysaccharide export with SLBB domain
VTSLPSILAGLCALVAFSAASAQHPQPGDRLIVRILGGEQPLADTLLVSESGNVVLPKLGTVSVIGFDIATLPDSLRARFARYLRNPTVDVVVLRRIIVNGEVKKPDIYYVDVSTTLPDVIALAGGLTDNAASSKVSIRRGSQITRVPDWETRQSSVADLRSGDQVLVGRKPWLQQNFVSVASTAAVLVSIFITLRR